MAKVKMSIIIPSLNRVNFMDECLRSACEQTLEDIEIICIDAGSTDGTVEIIKQYAGNDARIIYINSDKRSYGYQINVAIRKARGEFITILESDDFLLPDASRYLFEFAKQESVDFFRAGVDLFVSSDDGYLTYGQLRPVVDEYVNRKIEGDDTIAEKLLSVVGILGTAYRRSFLLENCITANESPGASFQDVGFCMQVSSLAKSFAYSNESVYKRRMDNETSSIHSVKNNKVIIDEYAFVETLIKKGIVLPELAYHQMIQDYYWRLSFSAEEVRKEFIKQINDDISRVTDYKFIVGLNELEIKKLRCLSGDVKEYQDLLEKQELSTRAISDLLFGSGEYVVVSAGKLTERTVYLQDYFGSKNIIAICDNDANKQNQRVGRYTVASVEEAVKNYPTKNYVIINRKYGDELSVQLQKLGIVRKYISIANYLPEIAELAIEKQKY